MNTEPQTVKVNANDAQTITIKNDPEGRLVIKKMDSVTKAPLSDVTFKATTLDGAAVGTSNGEFHTDANGYIRIDNLAPGSYVVQETQTKDGYVLDNTPKTIEVKDHQTYMLEFFNQPQGGLVIHKVDSASGKLLQGVEFSVKTADG